MVEYRHAESPSGQAMRCEYQVTARILTHVCVVTMIGLVSNRE